MRKDIIKRSIVPVKKFNSCPFKIFNSPLNYMRKNFRPHAKQNKIANSFRKKTIDPGVDLNLKKDDDNLENIDEYWNMAEYVMDEDQDLTKGKNIPKEAKALIGKKSNKKEFLDNVESSVLDDVMDISTEGSKMTSDSKQTPKKKESETPKKKSETPKKKESETPKKRNYKQTIKNNKQTNPENEESEDTLFDISNIRESLSHTTFKKMSNVSNTSGFDTNLEIGSINEVEKNTSKMGMQRNKSKQKKVDDKKVKNKRKETKSPVSIYKKDKLKRRSSIDSMANYKGEPLMGKNNKVHGMTKISTLFQGKSILEPLITKQSLESGILFLKEGASILQETADHAFTFLLLKGTVEISVNNELYKLDRDSCMFVDIGSSYNIVDKSRGGSTLFITFKAK